MSIIRERVEFRRKVEDSVCEDKYWTAFYTKPKHEKKASDRLSESGFEVYCPTTTTVKKWSDRKKKIKEPLFKGYLFAKVDEKERINILKDTSIIANLHWLGKPSKIKDEEIQSIRRFLNEHPTASAEQLTNSLSCGDKVRIVEGEFRNFEGEVKKVKKNLVHLDLEGIGFRVTALIRADKTVVLK